MTRSPAPRCSGSPRAMPRAAWAAVCAAVSAAGPDPFPCARLLRAQVEIGLAAGHLSRRGGGRAARRDPAAVPRRPGSSPGPTRLAGRCCSLRATPPRRRCPLSDAAAGFRRMAAPYDAARADLLLAAAYRALGDSDTADAPSEPRTRRSRSWACRRRRRAAGTAAGRTDRPRGRGAGRRGRRRLQPGRRGRA